MHKKTFLLFLILCLTVLNVKAEFFQHFFDYDLLQKIDTNVSKIHIYNVNKKDSILCSIIKYDAIGRLKSIMKMNTNGKTVSETTIHTYFENTDIILSSIHTKYTNKEPFITINAFEYDSLFRKIFEYEFDKDTLDVSVKHFYYLNGNLFKIDFKPNNLSNFYSSCLFYYDPQNRLIKKDYYSPARTIIYSDVYEYNKDIKSQFLVNKNGKFLLSEDEYYLNKISKQFVSEDKKLIEGNDFDLSIHKIAHKKEFFYDSTGKLKEVTYKYDNENRVSNILISSADSYRLVLKYFYK